MEGIRGRSAPNALNEGVPTGNPRTPPGLVQEEAQAVDEIQEAAWVDDLTFEDMMAHHGARDPAVIRVQSSAGPDADMTFLEKEASTKLYDGAASSRLKIIVEFLNLQARHGWSNLAMDDIFSTISDLVIAPHLNSQMPRSRQEARKVISDVGLDYQVIHACPCDKTLYFGTLENATFCPKCKISRYGNTTIKKTVPRKV